MRVLVTGMGGELGSRVAALLEADRRVKALVGMDIFPPRRTLRPSTIFHIVDPRDRRKVVPIVRQFAPTAIVHLGVYEPDARSSPHVAAERTAVGTLAVLGAAADLGGLKSIVLRSGLEIYGRAHAGVTVPDEDVVPVPRSGFGRSLLEVERLAVATARSAGVPLATLRFAPIVGAHFPSPLSRLLRLSIVPYSLLADPPFSVIHPDDAARAVVGALMERIDQPLNLVAPGAVTVSQAARMGRRVPLGLLGPEWALVRRITSAAGAPIPPHLLEVLHRGRTADGRRADELLSPVSRDTQEIIAELYRDDPPPAALHLVRGDIAGAA